MNKDEQMSDQGIQFGDLIEELQNAFYAMPAPESDNLAWSHVETAKKINVDLKELIAFLSK